MTSPKQPNPRVDIPIIGIIATIQGLVSILGLLIVPFAFNYGGAAAWPSLFSGIVGYLLCGLGSAIFLGTRMLVARILGLVWHAILLGYLLSGLLASGSTTDGNFWVLFAWSFLSFCYLAATSIPIIWTAAKRNPQTAAKIVLVGSAVILIWAGFYDFYNVSITGLEMQLHSTDNNSRCAAARRLGKKGPAAAKALPALEAVLDNSLCDDSGEFADDTATDIEQIGGIDPLIDVMKNGKLFGRSSAASHLRRAVARYPSRAADLKQAFAAGLKDKDEVVRQSSVEGLGELGPRAVDLLPELLNLVDDPSAQVRGSVVESIGKLGSLDGLRQLLSHPDWHVRNQVIRQMDFGRYGPGMIPLLESELQDPAEANSQEAAQALGRLGRSAKPALISLEAAAFNSPDFFTRIYALDALRQIGPEGLPAIEKAVRDKDDKIRDRAIALLGSYGQDGLIALASFLSPPWTPVNRKTAEYLNDLGPRAWPALHALEYTALHSPDQRTRISALDALGKIGEPGYPTVARLLADPDPMVSAAAQKWLRMFRGRYPLLKDAK